MFENILEAGLVVVLILIFLSICKYLGNYLFEKDEIIIQEEYYENEKIKENEDENDNN